MAALTITATSVDWTGGTPLKEVTFGATVTRGQVVYKDTSDGEWKLLDADSDLTSLSIPENVGLALSDGSDARPGLIAKDGAIVNIGATAVAGETYVASSSTAAGGAAGGISAVGDLGSGDTPVFLFTGDGAGTVTFTPRSEGVAKA